VKSCSFWQNEAKIINGSKPMASLGVSRFKENPIHLLVDTSEKIA